MEYVEAGVPCPFEITYDSASLDVAMQVFDVTSGTPVFVDLIPMTLVVGFTYFASFTPLAGKQYVVNKAVYTNNTYTELNDEYSQGSESLRADDFAGLFLNAVLASYQQAGSVGQAISKAANGGSGGGVGLPLVGYVSAPLLVGCKGDLP